MAVEVRSDLHASCTARVAGKLPASDQRPGGRAGTPHRVFPPPPTVDVDWGGNSEPRVAPGTNRASERARVVVARQILGRQVLRRQSLGILGNEYLSFVNITMHTDREPGSLSLRERHPCSRINSARRLGTVAPLAGWLAGWLTATRSLATRGCLPASSWGWGWLLASGWALWWHPLLSSASQ